MTDIMEKVLASPVGRTLGARLGLTPPPELRRGRGLPDGPVVLGSLAGGTVVAGALALLGVPVEEPVRDDPALRTADEQGRLQPPRYPGSIGAVVVDATGCSSIAELEGVRALLRPAVRALAGSGRVIVAADDPDAALPRGADAVEVRAVRHALEGITRSLGKELRGGATANLLYLHPGTTSAGLASTIAFLLEGRSAFVDGQCWRVGEREPAGAAQVDGQPFAGRIVVVTGAARGIGAQIAHVLARDGAELVLVDVPAAGQALAEVANTLHGSALQLDITAPNAGERIAAAVASRFGQDARLHAIVHNAGITRDRLLANTDEQRWANVLTVNLAAQLTINPVLLRPDVPGGLADGGRIVAVASTSGIAGNRGQTNYAASKAGVIGVVTALAPQLADRGITVNAVAPGFIETDMTAAIPPVQRQIFRRSNSLLQGGLPIDVAETIAYLADPASAAITGQIIRVCGQNIVGA